VRTGLCGGRTAQRLFNREQCDVGCGVAIREVRHILGVTGSQGNVTLRAKGMEASRCLMQRGIIPTVKRESTHTHEIQCNLG